MKPLNLVPPLILLVWCFTSQQASATPVTYTYTGNPYVTFGGPTFSNADFTTGTIVLDYTPGVATSNISATSFSLTTTIQGGPGFTITDSTPGVSVVINNFNVDVAGNITNPYRLIVRADVDGNTGTDELRIAGGFAFADIPQVQIAGSTGSPYDWARNSAPGTFQFSPVPESGSTALSLGLSLTALLIGYRRNSLPNRNRKRA